MTTLLDSYTVEERTEIARTIRDQIGFATILAISGGKWLVASDRLGIVIPAGSGYVVKVEYRPVPDLYSVERVFRRGGREWVKGVETEVYWLDLEDSVWRASCYRNVEFGGHDPDA